MIDCTVLVLTYKGKHHLEFLLPSIKEAIAFTPLFNIEVLIVDNGKDEDTRNYVQVNFPEYRFEFSPVNDYLFSLNPFVAKMSSEFVLILNDDMKVDKAIFEHSIPLLKLDSELFSLNCRLLDWNGEGIQNSVRLMKIAKGWVSTYWREQQPIEPEYTLYGGGGSAFFRVSMYTKLGGFDPYYRPAYCEDLDLGHRAWKMGWPSIIQPLAVIYHRDGATIKEQFLNQSDVLTRKIYTNQVKWMLRNINYPGFKVWFYLLLPKRILLGWLTDKNSWISILNNLTFIFKKKHQLSVITPKVYDKSIFHQFLGISYKRKSLIK